MVKLTKEDENKLGQILKELNEMRNVLKGGEGSGIKGHKTTNIKGYWSGGRFHKNPNYIPPAGHEPSAFVRGRGRKIIDNQNK